MHKKTKTIVVTGGLGFIGSHFIKALYDKTTFNIINIDKETYAADINRIPLAIRKHESRYTHIKEDINSNLPKHLLQAEYVVNFAAETHVDNSIDDGNPFIQTNVAGVLNLLEFFRESKTLNKFVQISTDEVYGDMSDLRGRQSADESYPLRPSSYYSASKASADLLVQSAARTYGIDYLITRSCNNFGANQDPEKFIPKIFEAIHNGEEVPLYGDGLQTREWISVEDNVQIILNLMSSSARNEIYNIGSGYHNKNIELIKYIGECLEAEVVYKHVKDRLGHDRVYRINNSKVETFLGERVYQPLEGFLKDQANELKSTENNSYGG